MRWLADANPYLGRRDALVTLAAAQGAKRANVRLYAKAGASQRNRVWPQKVYARGGGTQEKSIPLVNNVAVFSCATSL